MNEPLDDIFYSKKPLSAEEIRQQQLKVIFEWIMSFSVLFWAIGLTHRFGNDWTIILKGVLLIGLFTTLTSFILSFILMYFKYKRLIYCSQFHYWWLLLMSFMNGLSILMSLLSLL